MGYEVEQRAVTIGEDLSEYDEVIVFIAGPRQLVATKAFEGLWAVANRPDAILAVDDWQVKDLFKGVLKCEDPKELFADFILGVNKKTIDELKPFENDFVKAIQTISSMKNRMLISAFSTAHLDKEEFGPHLIFEDVAYPRDRLFVYNPNPYHRNRKWEDIGHDGVENPSFKPSPLSMATEELPAKRKQFNFASLVQSKTQKWLKKQGYTGNPKNDEQGVINDWQVDLYGSKADTQKRLTEDEMVKVITQDWGCLMPGYAHAGGGWWRARPLQCADANSILIGDEKELRVYYGNDYPYYELTAKDLPNCTDEELKEIAQTQKDAIYKLHPLDKDVQKAELKEVLNAKK